MKPINGVIPYDLFIERTDPSRVRLQLDFGNMEVGGGKPLQYLRQYRDRYWTLPREGRRRRTARTTPSSARDG